MLTAIPRTTISISVVLKADRIQVALSVLSAYTSTSPRNDTLHANAALRSSSLDCHGVDLHIHYVSETVHLSFDYSTIELIFLTRLVSIKIEPPLCFKWADTDSTDRTGSVFEPRVSRRQKHCWDHCGGMIEQQYIAKLRPRVMSTVITAQTW